MSISIGVCGLGKLGLPVAVAMARKYSVYGYDVKPHLFLAAQRGQYPHKENDLQRDFDRVTCSAEWVNNLHYVENLRDLADFSDIIFVAVQTPHDTRFDGTRILPYERADFDYSYLISAVKSLSPVVRQNQTVVIVSTVSPGTIRKEVLPILGDKCNVVYNPFFIALGTVMKDFLNPEFALIGEENGNAQQLVDFYYDFYDLNESLFPALKLTFLRMSIESAELAKMAYNCYISQKISFLNTLSIMAHEIPNANVDDVGRIFESSPRLIRSFNKAGMGFGGACFPRDCVAMSWLLDKMDIPLPNIFDNALQAKENYNDWLASFVLEQWKRYKLPIVVLGKAYKPESDLTCGSPAVLLYNTLLTQTNFNISQYDPFVDGDFPYQGQGAKVFVIATKHDCFRTYRFALGSTVIDPFRYIEPQDGVNVIPVGVGR